jgi:hypothetical protein
VAFIWADWQSCAADKAQLLDPVLGQYKEAFVVVRCSYRGQTFSRCVYIWVDSDFAIARGLHQGYPKKLGSIHMTRPHPYGPAPRVAPGGQFGASLAAADRRLAEARITLLEEAPANGFVNAHPMAHNRFVRSIDEAVHHSGLPGQRGQRAQVGLDDDVGQAVLDAALDRDRLARRRGVEDAAAERQAVLERTRQLRQQHVAAPVDADHVRVRHPDHVDVLRPKLLDHRCNVLAVALHGSSGYSR